MGRLAAVAALLLVAVSGLMPVEAAQPAEGPTLAAVRRQGEVRCGVSLGLAGFSTRGGDGVWSGFDVDYCRAVAAAVLADARRVVFVPVSVQKGLAALAAGEIDVLSRTVTITLKRVVELGVQSAGVNFYDGQGFLLQRGKSLRTLHQLNGARICFQSGTTAEDNLRDAFAARHIVYDAVAHDSYQGMIQAFVSGACDAVTADFSTLASLRLTALSSPEGYALLRQRISKEPFGPMVRKGDDGWFEIARWTLMAMIEAEELGVSRATLETMRASTNPRVRRLLGITPGLGVALGLDDQWAARIIAQVGNYGESFETNLGASSLLKLDRGLNELWTHGGLMIAFPMR